MSCGRSENIGKNDCNSSRTFQREETSSWSDDELLVEDDDDSDESDSLMASEDHSQNKTYMQESKKGI